ncbi:endonuclease [Desulfococcaceae bacterium HSG7]|nr:endonuclease [Desulfococcaceae bacterium HSG9]MDM8555339.1 endonuclease [Desulfococcaceae bacterium HSG7]
MKMLTGRLHFFAFIILILIFNSCGKSNKEFESFSKAKKLLLEKVYYDNRKTFYCKCSFTKNKKVRCKTGKGKRAKQVEWEHIVPASRFGKTFRQWKSKKSWECILPEFLQTITGLKCKKTSGRQNLRAKSKKYRLMESDMYNLVPAVGFINQKRSNLAYGEIPGEKRAFGSCDFEVANGIVEPAPAIRGNIARTYFYMNKAYPSRVKLDSEEKQMFKKWDKSDPVDKWECERSRRIEKLQGNVNTVVKDACKKASK